MKKPKEILKIQKEFYFNAFDKVLKLDPNDVFTAQLKDLFLLYKQLGKEMFQFEISKSYDSVLVYKIMHNFAIIDEYLNSLSFKSYEKERGEII